MKRAAQDLLFGLLIAFAFACVISLCGCSRAAAAQSIRAHAVVVTSVLALLMVPVVLWQIFAGTREARERRREHKQTREAQLEDLRRLARAARASDMALKFALGWDWGDADKEIGSLPRGERRDTLKRAVSELAERAAAEDLIRTWTERAQRWELSDQGEMHDMAGVTLLAASELADALGISFSQDLCCHPYRDAQRCPTCGAGFQPDEARHAA